MATMIPDAGELNQKVRLMSLTEIPRRDDQCHCAGGGDPQAALTGWTWSEYRKAWAKVTPTDGLAIYANSGVGGREAEFVLRRQRLNLGDAILWRDQFCFPVSIAPLGPGHLKVKAALVTPRICRGIERDSGREIQFPAVITEKYMGHAQAEPMAQNAVQLVLVTPSAVKLALGSLVTVGEDPEPFWVKIPHEMDPYKHEYEVERTVEP